MLLWPPSPIFNVGRKVTILFGAKSNIDKGGRGAISKVTLPSQHFCPGLKSQLCGFTTQLVEHYTGVAEVMGLNPVETT